MTASDDLGTIFLAEARRQLDGCLEKIHHCAEQLDDAGIWWRADDGRNSIGNLLIHLAGNLGQRFGSNLGGDPDRRDRAAEFAARDPIPGPELLARLDTAADRAREVLAGFDPSRVGAPMTYPTARGPVEATALALIVRTLLHLAAHTQEIIAMTRTRLGEGYRTFGRGDW